MKKQITIVICILAMVAGCNETQQVETVAVPDIVPLIQHLIPIQEKHQNWKDAYGDGWESLVAYNFIILRDNEMVIARTIEEFHPELDPNVPTLESRVEELEVAVDYFKKYGVVYMGGPNDPNGAKP